MEFYPILRPNANFQTSLQRQKNIEIRDIFSNTGDNLNADCIVGLDNLDLYH